MLTILNRSSGNILGVRLAGKLTHADHQQLISTLEKRLQTHDKLRVLIELEDLQGWEMGTAWDDLKFSFRHGGDIERCTVVGEKAWQKWMTKLARPFFNVQYFDKEQLEEAWRWIRDGLEEAIRRRAYFKWEAAGKPAGEGTQFWVAAEKEICQGT